MLTASSPTDLDATSGPYHLPSTRWSLVIGAGSLDSRAAAEALEKLCLAYQRPILSYMRHHHDEQEVQDLAQDFFTMVVAKDLFAKANRDHGPFRAFLLTLLKRFSNSAYSRARALKRGGGRQTLSLEELSAEGSGYRPLADSRTPEADFDRAWALTILEKAVERLRTDCIAAGRQHLFDVLQPFLHQRDVPQAEVAERLGMTHGALRVALHRLRHRFGALVREEIAETVGDRSQVEQELQHLMAALAQS